MDIFQRDRLRKEAIARGEPDPFPPQAAPPQPAASSIGFAKPFTDEEKRRQQMKLAELLRNRK